MYRLLELAGDITEDQPGRLWIMTGFDIRVESFRDLYGDVLPDTRQVCAYQTSGMVEKIPLDILNRTGYFDNVLLKVEE